MANKREKVAVNPTSAPSKPLPETTLRAMRALLGKMLLRKWEVAERGLGYVPASGPVIFAANHIGWLDGPLLVIKSPRAVHTLAKSEEFQGRSGLLLRASSQIRVERDRVDAGAIRKAIAALSAGQAVGIFPEGARGNGQFDVIKPGIGYLALITGAPIVPVAIFGTREKGGDPSRRPRKGAKIDLVYGRPMRLDAAEWPRTAEQIDLATQDIHRHLKNHVASTRRLLNRDLPGDVIESPRLDAANVGVSGQQVVLDG